MYSEKFEKVYQAFQEKYYKSDVKIPKRKLKNLRENHNNIGIIKFDFDYDIFTKQLCWYITSAGIKFDRLYFFIPVVEKQKTFELFTFNQLVNMFSDIIEIHETNEADAEIINLIKQHKHDEVYVLNPNIIYNTLNIPYQYGTKTVYNLHKDLNYNKKHSYYKSCLQYDRHDDTEYYKNTIVTEPDTKNILLNDFVIPADVVDDDLTYDSSVSFVSNLYYYFFMHDIKIYFIENTMYNVDHDMNLMDSELLHLISHETDQSKIDKWYFNFPKYKASKLLVNSTNKIIDLAFVSMVAPETIIETILQLKQNYSFKIRDIYILDNVQEKNYENHMYMHHDGKLTNYPNVKILYNNVDQLFKRTIPTREDFNNGVFGEKLFDESIEYLTSTSTADYLVIIDDKTIINSDLNFDTEVIWNGNFNENKISRYVNVFNLNMMKEHKIKYTNFNDFYNQITELKLKTKRISLLDQIILPEDFDKYASVIFRVANTRGQILYNYLLDNYNYRLMNYEDYNSGNTEL